jgi:hypothetical protein
MQVGQEYLHPERKNIYYKGLANKREALSEIAREITVSQIDEQIIELLKDAKSEEGITLTQSLIVGCGDGVDPLLNKSYSFSMDDSLESSCLTELRNLSDQKVALQSGGERSALPILLEGQVAIHSRRYDYCSALVEFSSKKSELVSPAGIWKSREQLLRDASKMLGKFKGDKSDFLEALKPFEAMMSLYVGPSIAGAVSGGAAKDDIPGGDFEPTKTSRVDGLGDEEMLTK